MKSKKDAAPVSAVYQYEEPPDLRSFDDAKGGVNPPPAKQTDEGHRSRFKPEPQKKYDYVKREK